MKLNFLRKVARFKLYLYFCISFGSETPKHPSIHGLSLSLLGYSELFGVSHNSVRSCR